MALGRLWQCPKKIHAKLLEGDADDGEWNEQGGSRFLLGGSLALGTALAEGMNIQVHARPDKPIPELL